MENVSDAFEALMQIPSIQEGPSRIGYLFNCKPYRLKQENKTDIDCVLCYFSGEDGQIFKTIVHYEPYFYVKCQDEVLNEVHGALHRQLHGLVSKIEILEKVDLELTNHLSGLTGKYIKLSFRSLKDLLSVRKLLQKKMSKKSEIQGIYDDLTGADYLQRVYEMREWDVTYYTRCLIDLNIRCGLWYEVTFTSASAQLSHIASKLTNPNLRILAFDIETTKLPLKFPVAEKDQVMMISYVIDGSGFLIVNREIVGADIEEFEFSPKEEFHTHFSIFNEPNELMTLKRFFTHIRETMPIVFVTFNGDNFDWPFIETRAKHHGLDMGAEISVTNDTTQLKKFGSSNEFKGGFSVHMDCYYWVQRDAYLPQGSHGLKKVTEAKLGYNPIEVDPEEMVPFARDRPHDLAAYSVSDAASTYYLYMKMIHDFIFALSTIIPMHPDDVLRKGSGTLCEHLLMAQAYNCNIVFPNKKKQEFEKFYNSNLIETETYLGGHVEALEVGVYRNDIPVRFRTSPDVYQQLIDDIDKTIDFCVTIENGGDPMDVTNRDEVREQLTEKLAFLRDNSNIDMKPLIYHLDVAAMYPNIILSNRLQPTAVIDERVCAGCEFNKPENDCKRELEWQWRGEIFPLNKAEYDGIKAQLEHETFNDKPFSILSKDEQQSKIIQRVKEYSKKVYNQIHSTKIDLKKDLVCMRENSFYVDTVRAFRDRRYEYKNLVKVAARQMDEAMGNGDLLAAKEAEDSMNLYDSLQLAHKIILNSFYGYVMRKGARWYSMEMAGMVTHIGANIIRDARILVEQLGKPLELDTDGIWCLLPEQFPENYFLQTTSGKKLFMSYGCSMLNLLVYDKYKNTQYQEITPEGDYEKRTEMSIFFEIDGPYKAMVLPASTEEGKMLKKRYAVFHLNGKLAELKGFEIKRRGELKIIKVFQGEVFSQFVKGDSLEDVYAAVGQVADRWYDILAYEGAGLSVDEIIDYLGEKRVMSKALSEYGAQRSTSITTARRLGELLGQDIVQDKGLNCHMLISKKPVGDPVSERAIPAVIFSVEKEVRKKFLRLWLKESAVDDITVQEVIDWDYYKERLGNSILKIITIPAALQRIQNPNPRIAQPEWLKRRIRSLEEKFRQKKIDSMFKRVTPQKAAMRDLEDIAPIPLALPEMPEIPIPIESDFKGWLAQQQNGWRKRRKENLAFKKIRREPSRNAGVGRLQTFFRNSEEALLYSQWQILGIYPTPTLGEFSMWIICNDAMYQITLEIPRVITISSQTSSQNPELKQVKRMLPQNRTAKFLYENTMTEQQYQDRYYEIMSALNDPRVEGVHETKIPLLETALLSLTCTIKPKVQNLEMIFETQGAISGHKFSINDFELSTDHKQYLGDLSNFHLFPLFHIAEGNRHILAVFLSWSKILYLFIVSPGDKPGLKKSVQSVLGDLWAVNVEYPKDIEQATRNAERLIAGERSKPGIVFANLAANLVLECPVIQTRLDEFQLPGLDWQRLGVTYLCEQFANFDERLVDMVKMSQYSGIPLGNCKSAEYITDILFGRSLKFSKFVLWWGERHHPGNTKGFQIKTDLTTQEFITPGFYTDICAEIDLGILAANAVLCCRSIDGDLDYIEDNPEDERVVSLNSFKRLRGLIGTWLEDITTSHNTCADKLLLRVYRWISSPSSALYDTALHLTVNRLMQKSFKILISEITKLGGEVVFAHLDKLIINTKKKDIDEARNYIRFMIQTLVGYPAFSYLSMEDTKYWSIMLFKDSENFAGVPSESDRFKIISNFQIIETLPPALSKITQATIAELIFKTYQALSNPALHDEIRRIVTKDITQRLFDYIPDIQRRQGEGHEQEEEEAKRWEFPERIGTIRATNHPALEFVKVIVHILGLDIRLQADVHLIRKNLLKMLQISDFAPEAQYQDPFVSLIIPEVICNECLYLRDLDLCRDPHLLAGKWVCQCQAKLPKAEIQSRLLALVQKKFRQFQTQDYKCKRCKLNQCDLMSKYCECSGDYYPTMAIDEMQQYAKTVAQVAEFHNFKWLLELVRPILN